MCITSTGIQRAQVAALSVLLLAGNGFAADDTETLHFSPAVLIRSLPAPPQGALTGSEFVRSIAALDPRTREQAIQKQLLAGNLPAFLRKLIPVNLRYQPPAGKAINATVFVMPEYLAIGSEADFLRIPMNLYTAASVALRTGFTLPTRRIVDAIYQQSVFHFSPEPMTPGPQMRSTDYYRIHNDKIEIQARQLGVVPGALVAGHKKDVVLTNLLWSHPERIAIYGWHRLTGLPIQPLSTVHGACYADYSHGIRLVSQTVLVNGEARSIWDVLRDPLLSRAISDEGPIPNARETLVRMSGESACG